MAKLAHHAHGYDGLTKNVLKGGPLSFLSRCKRPETTALFACWMASLVWLLISGRYQAFLRPGFWPLLCLACIVLALFVAVSFFGKPIGRNRIVGSNQWIRFALLALPILYVIVAHDISLGSYAFENRSAAVGALANIRASRSLKDIGKDNTLTPLEILQYFKEFEGKNIVTEGMVYRGDDVPEQHFLVFRFLMICCAADALPAGALVAHDNAKGFEKDLWVRVKGVLGLKDMGGFVLPYIQAEKITPIDPPEFPYLIPSFSRG
jgi:uncharacterized repeat protein (TIGR03943 family)